ncbi:hypothetical protein GGR57DRAFT_267101 [Xylariaceae sp. FL1272]|nr:hypothetical protein GGR57DRAFT_267101 [Xylariaceae sp. FL1272]
MDQLVGCVSSTEAGAQAAAEHLLSSLKFVSNSPKFEEVVQLLFGPDGMTITSSEELMRERLYLSKKDWNEIRQDTDDWLESWAHSSPYVLNQKSAGWASWEAKDIASTQLMNILANTMRLEATDPRDKIYALLGIASDGQDYPEVSYAVPAELLFLAYATYFAARGVIINTIRSACLNSCGGPSWVPNWNSKSIPTLSTASEFAGYKAGGDSLRQPQACTLPSPGPPACTDCRGARIHISSITSPTCTMSGCIMDKIRYLDSTPPVDRSFRPDIQPPATILRARTPVGMYYTNAVETLPGKFLTHQEDEATSRLDWTKAVREDAAHRLPRAHWDKWITSILRQFAICIHWRYQSWGLREGDFYSEDMLEPSWYKDYNMVTDVHNKENPAMCVSKDFFEAMFRHTFDPLPSQMTPVTAKRSIPFRATNQELLDGRRICITDKGHFGVVPNNSKVGDKIGIVSGAPLAFILEATRGPSGGRAYRLCVEAYIRGFMNGEALRDIEFEDIVLV